MAYEPFSDPAKYSELSPLGKMVNRAPIMRPSRPSKFATGLATPQQIKYIKDVLVGRFSSVLSPEYHNKIEHELAEMDYVKKTTVRILVPYDEPDGTNILSYAILVDEDAFLCLPGKEVIKVPCIYACGLATIPTERHRGHATQLLSGLIEFIRPKSGDYLISTLVSLADKLYMQFFKSHIALECHVKRDQRFPLPVGDVPATCPISESDLQEIIAFDATLVKKEVQEHCESSGNMTFAVVPSADTLHYRTVRSRLMMQYRIGRDNKEVCDEDWLICGAQCGKIGTPDYAFILWRITASDEQLSQNSLRIGRLRAKTAKQLQSLLQAAVGTCTRWGLKDICAQVDKSNGPFLTELGLEFTERPENDDVPFSRIDHGGDGSENSQKESMDHDFVCNDMYVTAAPPL